MTWIDLTLPTPSADLACDEALLDLCDQEPRAEVLRFWSPQDYFVVLGYANRPETEANLDACRARAVPIHRRCSGGGAVLQGPGCLNYSLILGLENHPELHTITGANRYIMERQRQCLQRLLGKSVSVRGITDLTLNGDRAGDTPAEFKKFSGNAQRRKRHALLFHGSFLLDFNLALIEQLLPMPSRQPDYRRNRPHHSFLANLHVGPDKVKDALRQTWSASQPAEAPTIPNALLEKYLSNEWNIGANATPPAPASAPPRPLNGGSA